MLDPKTVNKFYFTRNKHTTPNCPVEMRPNFNPSIDAQSYQHSTYTCSRTAKYSIPFFLDRPAPKFVEWNVNAHQARPGHHTQVNYHIYSNKRPPPISVQLECQKSKQAPSHKQVPIPPHSPHNVSLSDIKDTASKT